MYLEKEFLENEDLLNLFFKQSLNGLFFMMLDEPITWNDTIDKEKTLDYVFEHQRITKVNQALLDQYRITEDEFLNKNPNELFAHDLVQGRTVWKEFFDAGQLHIDTDERRSDGTQIWVEGDYVCIYDAQGRITGHFGTQQDVTERKRVVEALKRSEEKYRLLTENTSDVIWVFNLSNNKFTYVSPSIEVLRGFTSEEAMNETLEETLTSESFVVVRDSIASNINELTRNPKVPIYCTTEVQQICKNGDIIWVEISTKNQCNSDGDLESVGVSRNIEERKRAEREIIHLSYHDHITGLYNRRFYEEELKRLDTERNFPITLVMIDVNGLKLTNDAFGHKAGDLLLEKIAGILKKQCRADEIVARIGGDEFVLLLPRTDATNANKIIERINVAIANEKMYNAILSISNGFAVKTDAYQDMNEIFKEAEDDMYRHKLSESSSNRSKTIDLIMNSLYENNNREMLHSKRVSEICEAIAIKMNFIKNDVNQMKIAGLMHDIGKIGISNNILDKTEKLKDSEWHEIKRHSEIGYRILNSVNEFSEISHYVLEHHERWDGKGYPKGLKEEEISLSARIIAVADSYDAMTSDRAYRKGLSEEEAINEIKKCSGKQFDPEIAKVFIEKVLGKV